MSSDNEHEDDTRLVIPAAAFCWDTLNPCYLDPVRAITKHTEKARTGGEGGYNGQVLGRSETRISMTRQFGEEICGVELLHEQGYGNICIQHKCSPKRPPPLRMDRWTLPSVPINHSANTQGENLVTKMAAMGLRTEGRERLNDACFLSPRPSCHLLSL